MENKKQLLNKSVTKSDNSIKNSKTIFYLLVGIFALGLIFMIIVILCGSNEKNDKYDEDTKTQNIKESTTEKEKINLYRVNLDDINKSPSIFEVKDWSTYLFNVGEYNLVFSFENFTISETYNECTTAKGTLRFVEDIYTRSDDGYCLYLYDGEKIKIYWRYTVTPGNWDYQLTRLITGTFDQNYKTLTLNLENVTYLENDTYVLKNIGYSNVIDKLKERNIDSKYIYYDKQKNAIYDSNGLSLTCSENECEQISTSDANIQDFEDDYTVPVEDEDDEVDEQYKRLMGKCYIAEDVGYWDDAGLPKKDWDLVYCFSNSNIYKGYSHIDARSWNKKDLNIKKNGNDLYINNKKVNFVYKEDVASLFTIDDVIFEYYWMSPSYNLDF